MGLPAKLLAEGERALLVVHPHVRRLVRPALLLLVLTPVASYATAEVPPGDGRATLRLALALVAGVLALRFVVLALRALVEHGLRAHRPTRRRT